jgi:hypothetical protein
MKKALASIVLLASSAGVFALPAAARDRDDHYVNRGGYTTIYRNNSFHDRNRDWRDARRFRDHRGGLVFGFGFTTRNHNWR